MNPSEAIKKLKHFEQLLVSMLEEIRSIKADVEQEQYPQDPVTFDLEKVTRLIARTYGYQAR